MSGGFWEYNNYIIDEVAGSIENKIENNNIQPEYWCGDWDGQLYNDQVIEEFKKAHAILAIAGVYAHRADWLLSGDDGDDTFVRRTKEKLEDLKKTDKYGYITKILDVLK